MKDLIAHIEGINAKTQAWIDEDPTNRWAGMITTDPNIGKSMVLPHLLSTTSICLPRLLQMHQSLHMVLSFV